MMMGGTVKGDGGQSLRSCSVPALCSVHRICHPPAFTFIVEKLVLLMLRVNFPNYALSCQCVKGASFILFHSVLFGVKIGARLSNFSGGNF